MARRTVSVNDRTAPASGRTVGGPAIPDSAVWQDDFNDGNYDDWTVLSDSWSAANNYLENDGGGSGSKIARLREYAYGYWEWDHRHDPNFYGSKTHFASDGSASDTTGPSNAYSINHKNENNNYRRTLDKLVDGTKTELLDLGTYDGNWHTYRVEREDDGTFTVFVDGEDKGSVVDTEIDPSTELVLGADDTGHDWDNFDVGTL